MSAGARGLALARPRVVAHRGASAAAPENTLAAFRRAWDLGCEAIELDVHLSADGHAVVIHDQDLLRTAGDPRRVRECSLAELRALDVGRWKGASFAGERLSTLAEVVRAAPAGTTIFVEVKAPPSGTGRMIEVLGELLDEVGDEARDGSQPRVALALQSFDVGAMTEMSAALPGLAAYWTVGAPKRGEEVMAYPPVILERAKALGLAGVALDARGVEDSLLEAAAAAGLLVDVWTINEEAALARWLARPEVRWVETDQPELASAR